MDQSVVVLETDVRQPRLPFFFFQLHHGLLGNDVVGAVKMEGKGGMSLIRPVYVPYMSLICPYM